jgi:hypothetical protein
MIGVRGRVELKGMKRAGRPASLRESERERMVSPIRVGSFEE